MHDAFQPLVARVRPLGNTSRKYLRTIERDGDAFLSRLELSGVLSSIHLDRTSPAIGEDFQRIAAAARGPEETLSLLGTYYAVQFLHQNARTLEQLAYDLAERSARQQSYASFLERNEAQFSQLVSIYIEHVLRIVTPAGAGRFVILNVGTLGHQDDIDMAVLHDGCGSSVDVDRAVARLASQCQRYASPLDNYFAADVGAAGFCLSVDELHSALRAGGVGFVLVTELLRAEPVFGERQILERLRQEVTGEYYFRSGHDNARHELYLRGILGESRSLLLRPPPASHLNPKDDALRLIIGLAMAFKTIDRPDLVDLSRKVVRHLDLDYFQSIQWIGGKLLEINPRVSTFVYQEDFILPYLGIKYALGELDAEGVALAQSKVRFSRRSVRYYDQVFWDE